SLSREAPRSPTVPMGLPVLPIRSAQITIKHPDLLRFDSHNTVGPAPLRWADTMQVSRVATRHAGALAREQDRRTTTSEAGGDMGLVDRFARVFGGSIVPQEVETMLRREADTGAREVLGDRILAPNDYVITLSVPDYQKVSADPDLTSPTFA